MYEENQIIENLKKLVIKDAKNLSYEKYREYIDRKIAQLKSNHSHRVGDEKLDAIRKQMYDFFSREERKKQ